jgi:hypothetical protein
MTFNGGGGSYSTQGTSNPPSPIKQCNNWNYGHTHGSNVHNTTQVPPVCNMVSITSMPPPGPTLWVVTTRGYIKPCSQVPLANVPWLLNQPPHPPTTPLPLQCPFRNNGPWLPTAPGSWGFGPHATAYQCANNIFPSPTRNIHNGKYHGVQQWVQLSWRHALTSCIWSAQSWSEFLPEQLLTVRGGRWHTQIKYRFIAISPNPHSKICTCLAALLWTVNIDMDAIWA